MSYEWEVTVFPSPFTLLLWPVLEYYKAVNNTLLSYPYVFRTTWETEIQNSSSSAAVGGRGDSSSDSQLQRPRHKLERSLWRAGPSVCRSVPRVRFRKRVCSFTPVLGGLTNLVTGKSGTLGLPLKVQAADPRGPLSRRGDSCKRKCRGAGVSKPAASLPQRMPGSPPPGQREGQRKAGGFPPLLVPLTESKENALCGRDW